MLTRDTKWFFGEFLVLLCVCLGKNATANECCPKNAFLIKGSNNCSDGTKIDLNCEFGKFLLDPSTYENDSFTLDTTGNLLIGSQGEAGHGQFCVGTLQRNDSEASKTLAALVCFSKDPTLGLIVFRKILMIISIFFLVVTFFIYMSLPNLRDLQGKCVMTFVFTLICAFLLLLLGQISSTYSTEGCIVLAAFLYFFMTSAFFWNNVITFNTWNAVRNVSTKTQNNSKFVFCLAWGFGAPFVMVVVSFILQHIPYGSHIRPHFGQEQCWFRGKIETWSYFYGPVSVLLILNTIMFAHSSWTFWKTYKNLPATKIGSLRFKCIMYLKLFLLMGITWVFEIISFITAENKTIHMYTKYIWYFTDSLNASQGLLIFLILVVFRHKVRHGLYTRKVWNLNWPKSWGEKVMEESIVSLAEEMELDNEKVKMKDETF